MSVSLLLAVGSIAAVTFVGMRDHRAAKAARRGVLDRCVTALDGAQLSHAADEFSAPYRPPPWPRGSRQSSLRYDDHPPAAAAVDVDDALDRQRRPAGLRHPRAPRRHRVLFAHLALRAPARDAGGLSRRGADPRRRRRGAPARRSARRRLPAFSPIRASRRSPSRRAACASSARPAKASAAIICCCANRCSRTPPCRGAISPRVLDQLQAIRAITGAYGRARAA